MDRYFFHIHYGEESRDFEGTPLASITEARQAAVQLLGRMLIDEGDEFWDKPSVAITVEDASGLVLWSIETSGYASPAVASGRG